MMYVDFKAFYGSFGTIILFLEVSLDFLSDSDLSSF